MAAEQRWQSDHYDTKLDFVSKYGKEVLDWLNPKPGEQIVDLGCGTGDLTNEIHASGADVFGLDLSEDMLTKARAKYPHIPFTQADATRFHVDSFKDAIFSNAALHWIREADVVLECVYEALRPGGRFVAEFGGKGNVAYVTRAIAKVWADEFGIDIAPLNPWFFPSIGEYATMLEQRGFRVTDAVHFDRPTEMKDGAEGLAHWLNGFAGVFFEALPAGTDKEQVMRKVADAARAELFQHGRWYIDYKRIRIRAIKTG